MATILSEQTLIVQSQQGSLDAFNQLILQNQDAIYRYAAFLTNDPDLAADITQESFIKAFQRIGSLKGNSFRAWLFKITTNTARDLARQSTRHPMVSIYPEDNNGEENDSPVWLSDPNISVETAVQQHETSSQLVHFLNELSAEHRNILILIDLHEMDYVEAAQILNIPLGTVKSRLARARVEMKNKLLSGDEQLCSLIKGTLIATHGPKSRVTWAHAQSAEMTQCQ